MAIAFNEVVKIKKTTCMKCLSLLYTLPCKVDIDISEYLKGFGNPIYSLKTIKLLRIDTKDGYKIESKIGKNIIKFALPKILEGKDLDKESRKPEFEIQLADWISQKLDIFISAEQE